MGEEKHEEPQPIPQKEMGVREGITYTIGEFDCPVCKRHGWIRCNPKGRTKKHWVD